MCGICDEAGAEFGQHVWQMWLRNTDSAKFVQALSSKAAAAGARGVDDSQSVGGFGKHPQNMARELKRKAVRKSNLPPPYYAQMPCWNDRTNACDMHDIPFYLPHETLYFFIRNGVLSLASLFSIVCGSALGQIKQSIGKRFQIEDLSKHVSPALLWTNGDDRPSAHACVCLRVLREHEAWRHPDCSTKNHVDSHSSSLLN